MLCVFKISSQTEHKNIAFISTLTCALLGIIYPLSFIDNISALEAASQNFQCSHTSIVHNVTNLKLSNVHFRRRFRSIHPFCTTMCWNKVMVPPGHLWSITSYDLKMKFPFGGGSKIVHRMTKLSQRVLRPKKNTLDVHLCSCAIRSQVIGENGIWSYVGLWPDLRGHRLT